MSLKPQETFTVTRRFAAAPDQLFAAWSRKDLKRRWFVDHNGPEWKTLNYELDFRVGGNERGTWHMETTEHTPMAGTHSNETTYLDIREGDYIVYAYTMAHDGLIHSSSLATVEFHREGVGTRLVYSEVMVAPTEGGDTAQSRKGGWDWLLDNLAKEMEATDA